MKKRFWLLLCALSLSLLQPASADSPADWTFLQWAGISRQEGINDCGPAAVYTMLELLQWPSLPAGSWKSPLHMADIVDMLAAAGIASAGYHVDIVHLRQYFAEGTNPPLLIHFSYPFPHFLVLAAVQDNFFLAADPGIGWQWHSLHRFEQKWSGYTIAVTLPTAAEPYWLAAAAVQRQRLQILLEQTERLSF